jgi:NADP-reducing hydrogenase subunit HndD
MKKISIKINGKRFMADEDKTVMQVLRSKGFKIPSFCNHPDFKVKANCRICVVEDAKTEKLFTSCSEKVRSGMDILTDSEKVKSARNTNLELIFAEHIEKCSECIWRFECKLLKYARDYNILITTFKDRKKYRKTYKFANAVEIDGSQCIDCRNCIDACGVLQNINYLKIKGKGASQEIVPTDNKGIQCILCGQCALHCPVSSAQEQAQWKEVEKLIAGNNEFKKQGNKKTARKLMVAQFAPSVRVTIGEDFGLPYGKVITEQLVAGLRELGFDYVFDVNFAADLTTVVEAEELIRRVSQSKDENKKIKTKNPLPMFTSCCPGWVNYAEIYHPELLPNLTTARSPQIHNGGAIKTYWAQKMKINPKDIMVVSIMPCTAKKYEAVRPELKVNGHFPVDYVLTTRELSFMFKKNNINLAKLKNSKADGPLGAYSGAAVIFGGSGGVMESALRTAHVMLCDSPAKKKAKICKSRIDFKEVRGMQGVKEATVEVAGIPIRAAIVNGIGNVEQVLAKLDNYDYIEVMTCPGGCIGGGGQPIPTTDEIRKKRLAALYEDDKSKKIRISYENEGVRNILAWAKEKGHSFEHDLLHTRYKKRIKY